jgi:hypothetical protein
MIMASSVSATPRPHDGFRRELWARSTVVSLVCLVMVLLTVLFLAMAPLIRGDADEYLAMMHAWATHQSPDVREADLAAVSAMGRDAGYREAPQNPYVGLYRGRNGAWYSYHFWAYSLLAVPAYSVARVVGANPINAMSLTNLWLVFAAILVAQSQLAGRDKRKWVLLGLAGCGPLLWYLRWPSTEVFTWSFVVMGLSFLGARRHPLAALCVALATLQNPPVILLVAVIVASAVGTRDWRRSAMTVLAGALAGLPVVFYEALFGTPNLIGATGFSSIAFVTPARIWSMIADLDQGLLPFVPGLLALLLVSGAVALRHRHIMPVMLIAAWLGMIVLSATTSNWNSGTDGLMRYGLWLLPVMAWIVAEAFPLIPAAKPLVLAAIGLHGLLLLQPLGTYGYLQHSPLANFVLDRAPALYNPEPEIFTEREHHRDVPNYKAQLPAVRVNADGEVTKALVDVGSIETFKAHVAIDPDYLASVEATHRGDREPFYINPPLGVARLK